MTTPSRPAGFRGTFRVDDEARAVYSEAAGIQRRTPAAVAVPVDVDDLVLLVTWAADRGVALTARGSGSSMPGGAISEHVIVDLSRWNRVAPVDVERRAVEVEPGAIRGAVERAASAFGLRFPVDPSSGAFCTIGGMASTNAAGAHSMRFGSMRPWVSAIECVFADGTRATIRRGEPAPQGIPAIDRFLAAVSQAEFAEAAEWHRGVIKDSSGYGFAAYAQSRDLVDLLVGSEGTLTFFTKLELRLAPAPKATSSVLGAFRSMDAAVLAAARAHEAGAVACEMLDRTFLEVAAAGGERKVPEDSESALLAEVEGDDEVGATAAARLVEQIFRDCGATVTRIALDAETETELWELRHAASPILSRLDPNLKSMQFIEDCAVPREQLSAFVRSLRGIFARNHTRGVIFGHAGDCHVHANAMVDVRDSDWRERVERILHETVTLTATLGGTLSGEHGDGRLRAPFQSETWPSEAVECFRAIKEAFDPRGILNPLVKVAPPSEMLGAIKYDLTLPPLPARAAAALQRVERERAYSRFRLDLLDEVSS
jgi:FAD/FMN-containing dehydrogenase